MTVNQQHPSGVSHGATSRGTEAPGLPPLLQVALTSLDVSLEEELKRYRRYKAGYAPLSSRGFVTHSLGATMPSAPTASTTSLGTTSSVTSPVPSTAVGGASAVGTVAATSTPNTANSVVSSATGNTGNSSAATMVNNATAATPIAPSTAPSSATQVISTTPPVLSSSTAVSHGVADSVAATLEPTAPELVSAGGAVPNSASGELPPQQTLPNPGAIQLVKATTATPGDHTATPGDQSRCPDDATALASTANDPFDYLASSEELLKSLSEDEPDFTQIHDQPGFFSSLLTPVGIGSSLILLLSTATLSYVFLTDGAVRMGAKNAQPSQASAPLSRAESPGVSGGDAGKSATGLPNSPDLAAQEFVDLNLNTLSTLKTNPASRSESKVLPTSGGLRSGAQPSGVALLPSPIPLGTATTTIVPLPDLLPPAASVNPSAPFANSGTSGAISPPASVAASSGAVSPSRTQPYSPLPSAVPHATSSNPRTTIASPGTSPAATTQFPTPSTRSTPSTSATSQAPRSGTQPASASSSSVTTSASPAKPTGGSVSSPGYTVVAPYTGDRTLESAQQVVPDAYVRNYPDGARVQLGSFSDPEKARAVVEQLQRQGIDAQLQQP